MSTTPRSLVHWVSTLAFAFIASFACESGSTFPPSDMAFELFCPRWEAALAAQAERCDHLPPAAFHSERCARAAAGLVAGRRTFNRSRASRCLGDWQEASCAQFHARDFPSCSGLYAGQVVSGAACFELDDCQSDLFCDRGTSAACPGVCRQVLAKDADCSSNAHACPPGSACVDTTDAGRRCRAYPLRYPGDTCTDAGSVCFGDAACVAGVCQLLPVSGEPCGQRGDVYLGCAYDAWCDGPRGGPPGVCRDQLPLGAACTGDLQCAGANALCVQSVCAEAVCPA